MKIKADMLCKLRISKLLVVTLKMNRSNQWSCEVLEVGMARLGRTDELRVPVQHFHGDKINVLTENLIPLSDEEKKAMLADHGELIIDETCNA